jgi:hypothetical protein
VKRDRHVPSVLGEASIGEIDSIIGFCRMAISGFPDISGILHDMRLSRPGQKVLNPNSMSFDPLWQSPKCSHIKLVNPLN